MKLQGTVQLFGLNLMMVITIVGLVIAGIAAYTVYRKIHNWYARISLFVLITGLFGGGVGTPIVAGMQDNVHQVEQTYNIKYDDAIYKLPFEMNFKALDKNNNQIMCHISSVHSIYYKQKSNLSELTCWR